MLRKLIAVVFLFVGSSLSADPVQDLSMNNYKAGWYPNFYKGNGPLTCQRTCKAWVGSDREHEKSNEIDGQTEETSVCKITNKDEIIIEGLNEPGSHWLYGNQFDDYPVCHVLPIGIEPVRKKAFMCLCVTPDKCTDADLIISNIYDPVWDWTTGQSVVKVDVTNIGSSAAGNFSTRVSDPGTGASSAVVSAGLAAGSTATLVFYFNYWLFDPDAELHAEVDTLNEVVECDEENNKKIYFKQG
ncbi:CARDB domain-containing protein [Aliikangiella sp. G2MR2-5]|uniref:CARDB domain-containing protein n=1 Tax=Aliikangiella sp. G2MR2-5 TaxID=2788943 RepID=UPI0018AA62DA|nr:CARDB domain-containing protein [Aliikangiella sp. G2MR2-5]